MKGYNVQLGDMNIALTFNTWAYIEVSNAFGGIKQMYESLQNPAENAEATLKLLEIMANAAKVSNGERPDYTAEQLTALVPLEMMGGALVTFLDEIIRDADRTEYKAQRQEKNGRVDLVLEKIRAAEDKEKK